MKKLGIYIILLAFITKVSNVIVEMTKLNEVLPPIVFIIASIVIMVGLAILVAQNNKNTILVNIDNKK